MLNSNDPTNSKVFAGLVSLILIAAIVIVSFFKPVQVEVLYSIIALCASMFGLSALPYKNNTPTE